MSRARTGFQLRSPGGFEEPLPGSRPDSQTGGALSAHDRVLRDPQADGALRRRVGVIGAVGLVVAVGILVLDAAAITGGSRALAQATTAPQIVSGPSFSVEEGTATVATLVATDTDTDAADLEWSALGGADQSHFTLTDAGELSFTVAKDFENLDDSGADGVYEVSVSVTDGVSSDSADLVITVTNVTELTTLSGSVDVGHSENWAGRVATYAASSVADAGGLVWSLSGDDAGRFSIDDPGGALRFSIEPTGGDLFLQLPDFDDPLDDDGDGTYEVTVHVAGGGDQQSLDVEVTVTDEPEPGTLALSSTRPRLGETLTTTLTDPDGVTGTVTYLWERSVGRGTWAALANTAASRVPTAADSGHFLRVTATYQDGHASGNTVTARTSEAVTADRLSALVVSTTDSVANPGHALRPSFDAGILHYSIGCAATGEMMTLAPAAGSGVRLSINGTQVTSGESRTVAVDADSEVRLTLAAASGAATTYFVRCLSGDLLDMTVSTASGATGVTEDLILFGVDKEAERSIAIVDANGAVRFHRMDANWGGGYVRAAWVSAAGEYRYAYYKAAQKWQILNQNLEFIARVATVAPLRATNRHDITLLDDGNYIVMAYEPVDRDLSELTFDTFGTSVRMQDSAIQIRTPGGAPLLTWKSYDAIPLEDCLPRFPPGEADYAHINTLQIVDGHIVASFRGCNSVLRIDPDDASSHKVVWRLALTNLTDEQWDGLGKGPPPLDIIGDAEGQFCGQHGSSLLPNGHLILFDNGVLCMHDPWLDTQLLPRPGGEYSRAVEYALDLDNNEAVFLRDHSLGGTRSKSGNVHGHAEELPNGDWLIGWGRWGRGGTNSPTESVTQVDPNTGEEKFSITLRNADGSAESIRPVPLSAVALADVLPPLEASIVAGAHTSAAHGGAADRPTVAVAFNRPVVDFAATASASVTGATVEQIAPLVESGAPVNAYVFTLIPDGDADIGFGLLADRDCDSDPAGVCTADGTMLSVVPTASHTIGYAASNSAPEFGAAETGARSVAENTAPDQDIGAAIAATDDDLDTLSYSVAGADGAAFDLESTTGQLRTKGPLDHEAKDSYHFTLSVSDGKDANGNADAAIDATIDVAVTVSDVNEAPTVTGDEIPPFPENGTAALATFRATDPEKDVFGWSVSGTDSDDFAISGAGVLSFAGPPDFENPADADRDNVFEVTVIATDDLGLAGTLEVTVAVTDVDEEPVVSGPQSLSFAENQATDQVLGSYGAVDPEDPSALITRWSLSGSDAGDFSVSESGELSFRNVPDFERPADSNGDNVYSFSVRASDGRNYGYLAVTVTVSDVNEAPVITTTSETAFTYTENGTAAVFTFSATDPENAAVSWSVSGTDSDDFAVTSDSRGRGVLAFTRPPDFENPTDADRDNVYEVTVVATDDGSNTAALDVTVTVTNSTGTEEPTITTTSNPPPYRENGTSAVHTFRARDPQGGPVGWTVTGTDSDALGISSSGVLSFAAVPDFENPADADRDNVYEVTVVATDDQGLTDRVAVAVTVTDVNEGPVVSGSQSLSFTENQATDRILAIYTATDPEDPGTR